MFHAREREREREGGDAISKYNLQK